MDHVGGGPAALRSGVLRQPRRVLRAPPLHRVRRISTMALHPEQEASTCDECESRLVTTDGEIYCEGCGLVTDAQTFDTAPIWKTDDAGRLVGQQHGPPQTSGLGSAVGSMM